MKVQIVADGSGSAVPYGTLPRNDSPVPVCAGPHHAMAEHNGNRRPGGTKENCLCVGIFSPRKTGMKRFLHFIRGPGRLSEFDSTARIP